MKIYKIRTGLDAVGAGLGWSETTTARKPKREANRWFSTDADYFPLGPLPAEARKQIDTHWALSFAKNSALPDTFMTLGAAHFTGAPFAREAVCAVFEVFANGQIELIPITKFWSLHDKEEVPEQYYITNMYSAAAVIDWTKTRRRELDVTLVGRHALIESSRPSDVFVDASQFECRHVLRDAATSDWFCDDVFRAAIEEATPNTYSFDKVNNV